MRRLRPLLVALGLVAAVVVPYLALGGGRFEPTPVADPCEARDQREADGLGETIERIALAAVYGVACELGVSREELEQAITEGLVRAVDDADEAGALPGFVVPLVRRAAESVPPWLILEALESLGSFLPG